MKTASRTVLALSTLLLLTAAPLASAAPTSVGGVATKVVRFGDLDLSTAVGAETLYKRIAAAARSVCRDAPIGTNRSCRSMAVEEAVAKVGSPLLSSIHRSTAGAVEEVVRR